MLVTESLPLHMRGDGTKEFTFEKLLKSGKSSTLTNYGVTVEYSTNPAWYAVQAIPYLIPYLIFHHTNCWCVFELRGY